MMVRKFIVKLAANYLSQFFQKESTSKTNLKKISLNKSIFGKLLNHLIYTKAFQFCKQMPLMIMNTYRVQNQF